MFYSRKMVNYTADTGLTSMANQSTRKWVNISGQPQSTSIPMHDRWRGHSSMLDTWKVDVWETGVANLHQVRITSLRKMGQQDTQHDCTSDSLPLACCPGYLPSPFPCDQNRLTEAGPNIQIWNTRHQVTLAAELQALNCIGSQKPKSGFYPEPDEYSPHPNPSSST
jgi:hypothetical protein